MKILLVDDDAEIRLALAYALRRRGHDVDTSATISEALELARKHTYTVGVIDVMLPDGKGPGLCRILRDRYSIPTLLSSARDEDQLIVRGLNAGADDYVVKPVSAEVLEARLRTISRRAEAAVPVQINHTDTRLGAALKPEPEVTSAAVPTNMQVGQISLNTESLEAQGPLGAIRLTVKEASLLRALLLHRGRVVGRQYLIDSIWAEKPPETPRVIDTTVQRLRAKLERGAVSSPRIETLRGLGYRLR